MIRFKTFYGIYAVCLSLAIFLPLIAQDSGGVLPAPELITVSPVNHFKVYTPTVTFQWRMDQPPDTVLFVPEYYEVQFWSDHRDFSLVRVIYPQENQTVQSFRFFNFRDTFLKHGVYKWRVRAISSGGEELLSDDFVFTIPIPFRMQSNQPIYFPYAVKLEHIAFVNRNELNDFISQLYPKTHFDNHSEMSLIFRQPMMMNSLFDLQERLIFSSLIGIGAEIEGRFLLFENEYVGLYPQGKAGILAYGTSLEHYASQRYNATVGAGCVINPRGYVTWSLSWTPVYRVHYMVKKGGLRTFEGAGWELGCRLHVPRHICAPFHVFDIPVDLQKMAFEIKQHRIRDAYTDRLVQYFNIGMSYLFK